MERILGYRCTLCGREYDYSRELMTCPHCGETGILDIVFHYQNIKKILNRETLANDRNNSMWRYAPLMPIKGEGLERFLRVGWTPLYRSNRLGNQLGLKALYIKDDGLNPTASAGCGPGAGPHRARGGAARGTGACEPPASPQYKNRRPHHTG